MIHVRRVCDSVVPSGPQLRGGGGCDVRPTSRATPVAAPAVFLPAAATTARHADPREGAPPMVVVLSADRRGRSVDRATGDAEDVVTALTMSRGDRTALFVAVTS